MMAKRLLPLLSSSLREHMPSEYLENEAEYWRVRDELLTQYAGKWVAFHKGQVITYGDDFLEVMKETARKGFPTAYIDKVGEEGELEFRCRRVVFDYNRTYQPTSLPQARVTFTNFTQTHRQTFTDVIPDTGSDLSALPPNDASALRLLSGPYVASTVRGVGGQRVICPICPAYAQIQGRTLEAIIQVIPGQMERLLGREVLNQIVVTFDGPNGQVIFDISG